MTAVFGAGEQQVLARLQRFAPGDVFVLSLAGPQFQTRQAHSEIELQFGPMLKPKKASAINTTADGVPMVVIWNVWPAGLQAAEKQFRLRADERQTLARITTVSTTGRRNPPVELGLGQLSIPLAELEKCVREIVMSWGFAPERMASLQSAPEPSENPGLWLLKSPVALYQLRRIWPLETYFRLAVDEKGKPRRCEIVNTHPSPTTAVCEAVLRHGRFKPAVDSDGKSTPAIYFTRAGWSG